MTTVGFQRQRVTGDSNDVPLDQCVYFLFAWGGVFSSGQFQYHGNTRRGTIGDGMICLPAAEECTGLPDSAVHRYMHVVDDDVRIVDYLEP